MHWQSPYDDDLHLEAMAAPRRMPSLGGLLNPWDWEHVREAVEGEGRARIALVGPAGAGKRRLYERLRGWDEGTVVADVDASAWEDLGAFRIVDLPDEQPAGQPVDHDGDITGSDAYDVQGSIESALADADLVVFMLGEAETTRPDALRWFSRARALGRPTIAVAVAQDGDDRGDDGSGDGRDGSGSSGPSIEQRLGCTVTSIALDSGRGVATDLVARMVDVSPAIAVALGRESPIARAVVADRLVRRTALMALVTGVEPIPLVDVPIQLAGQMKMIMRLAAAHGRSGGDGGRAVMASLGGALAARYALQQALKLAPIGGWFLSGLLSALTTMMLGRAAAAHFAGRLPLKARAPHWAGRFGRLRPRRPTTAAIEAPAVAARAWARSRIDCVRARLARRPHRPVWPAFRRRRPS